MAYDFLYDVSDSVATLTFNRPQVMNALTFEVYAQLRDVFETLRYDEAVRAIVLTGAGDSFCSGGDVYEIIGELLKRDMKGHLEFTRMTGAVVQNMRLLDKPIIAALNGMTAGAGAVIALAADLRIASEKARFAFLRGDTQISSQRYHGSSSSGHAIECSDNWFIQQAHVLDNCPGHARELEMAFHIAL